MNICKCSALWKLNKTREHKQCFEDNGKAVHTFWEFCLFLQKGSCKGLEAHAHVESYIKEESQCP